MGKYDWFRKEEPEETVGSYEKKLEREKIWAERRAGENYKPTAEEEKIIKELTAPILEKILDLFEEIKKAPEEPEKENIQRGLKILWEKYLDLRIPQKMTKSDIEELIFRADTRKFALEDMPAKPLERIKFLEKEIDFLLEQLWKRVKK